MLDCVNSREQFKEIKVQFLEASSRSSSTLSVLSFAMFLKDMKNAVCLLKYVHIALSYQNLKSACKLGGSEDVHLRRGYLVFAFAT